VLRKFLSFATVGAIATGFQYIVLILLVELLRTNEVLASAIGFALSSMLNYRLNYRFTFRSNLPHSRTFSKFMVVAIVGLTINTTCMYVLVKFTPLHYIAAQVGATAITLLWSFSINSLWSFSESANRKENDE
jgi:putative flippase GtrA